MSKYHIITYGCQMNHSDSERLAKVLNEAGHKKSSKNEAEFLILNCCSVRLSAMNRVWGKIRNNKDKKIVLTGCILPDEKRKLEKKADIVIDINEMTSLPSIMEHTEHSCNSDGTSKCDYLSIEPEYKNNYTANVPIMTGCNNYCTYCAVPYTRGREKSRPVKDILKEVNNLVEQGYKEIILLGQNVNSYKSEKTDFPALLKQINKIDGNYWLNFFSSHPKDVSDKLINCFKSCRHLTPYFHLALQSGSDRILQKMNRKYTNEEFMDIVRRIRKVNPKIAITTDIIVGFPGESENDFEDSKDAIKKAKFDMAYIARFSPRPNTAAVKMPENVTNSEKKKRDSELTEVLKESALDNNLKKKNKVVEVLIDSTSKGYISGHTNQLKSVKINTIKKYSVGDLIKVEIVDVNPWSLKGKIYEGNKNKS